MLLAFEMGYPFPVIHTAAADYAGNITFYGYMIQAGGFNNYTEAWEGFDPAPAP